MGRSQKTTGSQVGVLVVGASAESVGRSADALRNCDRSGDFRVKCVPGAEEALEEIQKGEYEAVVLEWGIDTEVVGRLRDVGGGEMAVMVVVGPAQRERAVEALAKGADDFVLGDEFLGRVLPWKLVRAVDYRRVAAALPRAQRDRDVYLRVAGHWVKNNLQIIMSLLELQLRRTGSREAAGTLKSAVNRLKSMAMLQERVYRATKPGGVEPGEYIQALVENILDSYGVDRGKVKVTIDVGNSVKRFGFSHLGGGSGGRLAICGLIINELVSNSVKHAFDSERAGEIAVGLVGNGQRYRLEVSDNGRGLPASARSVLVEGTAGETECAGLRLVAALVRQLGGRLEVGGDGGAWFSISFGAD